MECGEAEGCDEETKGGEDGKDCRVAIFFVLDGSRGRKGREGGDGGGHVTVCNERGGKKGEKGKKKCSEFPFAECVETKGAVLRCYEVEEWRDKVL